MDPSASYHEDRDEIDLSIKRVFESGYFILGNEVKMFEKEFADYVGVKQGVGVANGTDAIELALRACDVGPGDIVFTVSHTAVATVAAIERCGANPFLLDILPESYTINPESLEKVLLEFDRGKYSGKGSPKAVIPVHLYGHPVDISAVIDIAKKYNLYVIEDCAQAHGAMFLDKMVGSFGDFAAFSFYPTKNLGAIGDGGIVLTNQIDKYEKMLALRQYGWKYRFISSYSGINSRLDELQAAILRVKLRKLNSANQRRLEIADYYLENISNPLISVNSIPSGIKHVFHQFVIQALDRSSLIGHLKSYSIGCAIHYPMPVHLQPAYIEKIMMESAGLPVTEKIKDNILSLPMYPQLNHKHVERVVDAINSWVG